MGSEISGRGVGLLSRVVRDVQYYYFFWSFYELLRGSWKLYFLYDFKLDFISEIVYM